ncbi:class I SAM-dependent methyltransferase [Rhizobium sp. L1K21]|uniref:class I SAM-dependent methyltransferase n=1 Tax=Rhizobium sp. L1K21 TaxID=2954933 RepID=UPI0020925B8D|nr:class I SAM-dependent methyltransferase [Rhizobium sp. L1K21]MCO6184789.1 class I SAM-dependent methyltransferase [Rhizobium sp. L1K21]
MARNALKTLFHPFDAEVVPMPAAGQRFIFVGAEAGNALPEGFAAELTGIQPFRPLFRALERQSGMVTRPDFGAEDTGFDGALILVGKHKGENENRIAQALERTTPGALIVAAGGKEDGIQALRKRLFKLGLDCEHMPKFHGQALWFQRPEEINALVGSLKSEPVLAEGRFEAAAGMFSHDRADPGSQLLAERLPEDFNGKAADFGAGWGYLSVMLAERAPRVKIIDLYEAHYGALEAAKKNMATLCPDVTAHFHWHDIAGEEVKVKYDLIIMNPPFHEGHATEPGLGQAFIKRASESLVSSGELLMVANRGLPYEDVLAAHFRSSHEVCRNARFKILSAHK